MRIAVGCDHAGFSMKQVVMEIVRKEGHELIDCGTMNTDPVDYPDFAAAVCRSIQAGKADRGILVCGSGVGASVAANKFIGIRAGLCHDVYSAHQGVEHDDMNILCLGGRIIGPAIAPELAVAFLQARFTNEERHLRRLNKVKEFENQNLPPEGTS